MPSALCAPSAGAVILWTVFVRAYVPLPPAYTDDCVWERGVSDTAAEPQFPAPTLPCQAALYFNHLWSLTSSLYSSISIGYSCFLAVSLFSLFLGQGTWCLFFISLFYKVGNVFMILFICLFNICLKAPCTSCIKTIIRGFVQAMRPSLLPFVLFSNRRLLVVFSVFAFTPIFRCFFASRTISNCEVYFRSNSISKLMLFVCKILSN